MDDTLSPFAMAFALWCEQSGISQQYYESLWQILQSLEDVTQLQSLPSSLSSLKEKAKSTIPILPVRRTPLSVVSLQLPTLSAAERHLAESTQGANLFFQDPVALLTALLKSPIFRKGLHIGMAEIVDEPTELWQSWSWGSSVKCSSGQFAVYPDGEPILPSDFVTYQCLISDCFCNKDKSTYHIGRVEFFGRDLRKDAPIPNATMLQIQPVLRFDSTNYQGKLSHLDPPFHLKEIIAMERQYVLLPERNILSYVKVQLDYAFGSDTEPQLEHETSTDCFFIRRVLDLSDGCINVRPLRQTNPLRGELEIEVYGRDKLKETFFHPDQVISVPYQLFIDGFGLYRNMYRSLVGFYLIPAGLRASQRCRRKNVYMLTFGPHGTNFHDVVEALAPGLSMLDRGIDINIPSLYGTVRVVASCLAFIGDMPQQNDNAGIKRPTATKSCRNCMVTEGERHNMAFDTSGSGRYHYEILSIRKLIDSETVTAAKDRLCREYGMTRQQTPLFRICPSLNLTTYFPSDPCHSEFSGMSKTAHELLTSTILSTRGQDEYHKVLRRFPVRRGWARLQSPITHLDSYQLQEHARASVIIPLLLRCAMKDNWIKPAVLQAIPFVFDDKRLSPKEHVVSVFCAVAKSNSVLTSQTAIKCSLTELKQIIVDARTGIQKLAEAAARSVYSARPTTRANSLISRHGSPALSVMSAAQPTSKKGQQIRSFKNRPNMHVGLHYVDCAKEYAIPNNNNVLIGEDKHRDYKRLVLRTNKRDVEKTLLLQESYRRSLQLAIEGSFSETEPALSKELERLYSWCPNVFKDLLQLDWELTAESEQEPTANKSPSNPTVQFQGLSSHLAVNAWAVQPAKERIDRIVISTTKLAALSSLHPFPMKL